ncbi:MAG TPA: response regulator transcription factor [Planctomycetota bacterium]|nr:response regulator transcription factor [Planctomycetota bacterium]
MRILVVEDEPDLAAALKKALVEDGFACDVAGDGRSGLFNAQSWEYDAIVLDLMLPGIDGWELLKQLRSKRTTPVLILTARDAMSDKLRGFNTGADDYLTKPFALEELLARLKALIRRSAGKPSPVIRLGAIQVDTGSRTVTRDGRDVPLAPKEYALVELLALNRGKLVTRTMIYDHIYDETDDSLSNVVDVYVSNIRKKLGAEFVETRRGMGYVIHA